MLDQTSPPLAEEPLRCFQVDADEASSSRDIGSCKASRLLWKGLGLAGLILIGLSAWAVFPAAPHLDSQSDQASNPVLPGVRHGSVVRPAEGPAVAFTHFLAPLRLPGVRHGSALRPGGYIPAKPSAGLRTPVLLPAKPSRRPSPSTVMMKHPSQDQSLFLESSQKEEAWPDYNRANLGDNRVVEIMASALTSLVEGEIMHLQAAREDYLDMRLYLRKSYYKTGSLIALAANSAAVLGAFDADSDVATAADRYAYHLGLAYRNLDDALDFIASTDMLGKPVGADMEFGPATARDAAQRWALDKSMQLARKHAQAAVDATYQLPPSDAREALVRLAHIALTRAK